jgi:trehalose 6-phosphate synthase
MTKKMKNAVTPITVSKSGLGEAGGLSSALSLAYDQAIKSGLNPSWICFGPGPEMRIPGDGVTKPLSIILERMRRDGAIHHSTTPVASLEPHLAYVGHNVPNAAHWMGLHELPADVSFDPRELDKWVEVQQALAKVVGDRVMSVQNPWIWAHDFQPGLAFAMMRESVEARGGVVDVSHFLHTPVPRHENVEAQLLPIMDQLFSSVIKGADDVGVHTPVWAENLCDWGTKRLGLKLDESGEFPAFILPNGRKTSVVSQPIGSDADAWESVAVSNELMFDFIRDDEPFDPSLPFILWAARLDVTKGGPEFALAVELLLERHPELLGSFNVLFVGEATRHTVPAYVNVWNRMGAETNRINGRMGNETWRPITRVGKLAWDRLGPLYRQAKVYVANSWMDGFLLGGWEYLICQDEQDPGVVGLSPHAGAAYYLNGATVPMDPRDISAMADNLYTMLTMSKEERIKRHQHALGVIAANPLSKWTARFEDRAQERWDRRNAARVA